MYVLGAAMVLVFPKQQSLLPTDVAMERVRAYQQRTADIAELTRLQRQDEEWFAALEKVLGAEVVRSLGYVAPGAETAPPSESGTRTTRNGKPTWTALIERFVVELARPVAYAEIKEMLRDTHLGDTLEKTDKSFYSAIDKLVMRHALVRYRGHLFSREAFKEYEERLKVGDIEELPDDRRRASPMADTVIAFLADRPEGAEGKQILNYLLGIAEFHDALSRNSTGGYNVLSRLLKREQLIKVGANYYLPEKQNGDP